VKLGILFLVFGYFLSQFYRSFLAVLTPVLSADLSATTADLSFASGIWFLAFACMQIPVGWALDKFGPRITSALMLAVGGGGGAVVFATAQTPGMITVAMALFGVGGAPIMMAAYYIFARIYPQAMFATLGGAMIGFGSAGNLAGSAPLAWVVAAFGWRATMWGLAVAALVIAAALLAVLRDPLRPIEETQSQGSLFSLFRDRNILLLLPMMLVNYAAASGIRGLWAGPYLVDVFAMDAAGIGYVTLIMASAMAIGNFAYGPLERWAGSKKKVVLKANLIGAGLCLVLWALPDSSWLLSAALFTGIGLFGGTYAVIIAHGQLFLPKHLTGRGITLLNLFGIGGVGLTQLATSAMAKSATVEYAATPAFYSELFLVFALFLLAGCLIYAFSRERPAARTQSGR